MNFKAYDKAYWFTKPHSLYILGLIQFDNKERTYKAEKPKQVMPPASVSLRAGHVSEPQFLCDCLTSLACTTLAEECESVRPP